MCNKNYACYTSTGRPSGIPRFLLPVINLCHTPPFQPCRHATASPRPAPSIKGHGGVFALSYAVTRKCALCCSSAFFAAKLPCHLTQRAAAGAKLTNHISRQPLPWPGPADRQAGKRRRGWQEIGTFSLKSRPSSAPRFRPARRSGQGRGRKRPFFTIWRDPAPFCPSVSRG